MTAQMNPQAFAIAGKYNDLIASIGEAMAANKAAQAARTEVAREETATLTSRVKDYATATATDGVKVEDARQALTGALTMMGAPSGSVKASGNHFAGFRQLLAEGKDISTLSTKHAQDAIASDEVKALKAAKDALAKYAKEHKWTSAEWVAMLQREGIVTAAAEADADESEVEEQARAAA